MLNENLDKSETIVSASEASGKPTVVQAVQTEISNEAKADGQQEPQEKLLKQSEVNEIVGAVRKEAAERARREALTELQQQNKNDVNSLQRINVDDERVRRLIAEENEKAANKAVANKIAMEFTQKLIAAKDKYQDFEQTVAQIDLLSIPEIVRWTNSLDNTAEVIYDIAKNPSKFANILMLQQHSPHFALSELQKLSTSIKKNQEAQSMAQPKEPLSQVNPSSAGIDNGKMSLRDLKKAPWLQG
ncbi:hypothetical protein HGB13_00265 [bacterium]|nr:hypothetical protein [bacterium]